MTQRLTSRLARAAARALAPCLLLAASALSASAQGGRSVAVIAPPGDTLRSVTPTFLVQATNFSAAGPLRVTLQLATTPAFTGQLVLDTTVVVPPTTGNVTIRPTAPLPEGSRIFYRATVTDVGDASVTSLVAGPKIVPPYVTPVSPPLVVGQPVRTRTPRFVWRSPDVDNPPGPWQYTITITNLATGVPLVTPVGSDTSFVPGVDLETNAFYTWSIEARLANSVVRSVVPSPSTFVVEDAEVPISITGMYPSFPNPFPTPLKDATCIWFDLKRPSTVSLDVSDLRGMHVRRMLPNAELSGTLPAGRYGRGRTELNEGCDLRFAWDGTDDRGRPAPEGVYIIRFRGDGVDVRKRVVFRGAR